MASVMATAFTVKKSHASGLAGFLISRILLGMAIGAVRPNISVFMSKRNTRNCLVDKVNMA